MKLSHSRSLGLFTAAAWVAVFVGPSCQTIFQPSLCELASEKPAPTAGMPAPDELFVRLSANLCAGAKGPLVLMDPDCPLTGEALAIAELDSNLLADPQLVAFRQAAEEFGSPGAYLAVPVSVSGTLQDNGRPCFTARFNVRVTKLRFLGPVTSVTAPICPEPIAAAPSN